MNPTNTHHPRARTTITGAALGLLIVVIAAVAYAATSSGAGASQTNGIAALEGQFALLRAPAGGPPPAQLAGAVAKAPPAYGLQLADARQAAASAAWLVPGNGWLCIAARDGEGLGMACTTASGAEHGELTLVERSVRSGAERIIGACPDGDSTISAFGPDATRLASSPVRENTYTMTARGAARMAVG